MDANENAPSLLQSVCLQGEEEGREGERSGGLRSRDNVAARGWGLWPWSLSVTQLGNACYLPGLWPLLPAELGQL